MFRGWFAIKKAIKNRKYLKRFLIDPNKQISNLAEVTPERLENANVAILVLDFDGVLAHHGALKPLPEVESWLRALTQVIGEQRVAVLTNKPLPARIRYFAEHFPSIFVVSGVRKKPYPDGLHQVAEYKGVDIHRILLLDDRLLTGMLATCLSYSQGWYFFRPQVCYWKHPLLELFFSFLRVLERSLLKCVRNAD